MVVFTSTQQTKFYPLTPLQVQQLDSTGTNGARIRREPLSSLFYAVSF